MDTIFMNSENSKTLEHNVLVLKLTDKLDLRRGQKTVALSNLSNPSIRMYINRIENRITFKIKSRYYLELLTPETMKLLGITESKITKDKNGENVPYLEIVELVLVHCNLVNNHYQQDSRILYTFVPN